MKQNFSVAMNGVMNHVSGAVDGSLALLGKQIEAVRRIDWEHPEVRVDYMVIGAVAAIAYLAYRNELPQQLLRLLLDHADGEMGIALLAAAAMNLALLVYIGRGWLNFSGVPGRRGQRGGSAVLAASEARRAGRDLSEERLARKTQELAAAVENISQGLVMFDGSARLVVCNRQYIDMYGLSAKIAAPGSKLRDILAYRIAKDGIEADATQLANVVQEMVRGGKAWRGTTTLPDGRSVNVLTTPLAGGGWVSTHEDATEAGRADRNLRRTEKFLASVIENVPTTVMIKDAQSLRYLLVNKAGERLFGLPRSKIIGKTAHELFPEPTADLIAGHDDQLLASGEEVALNRHEIDTPGGAHRLISATQLAIKTAPAPRNIC